MTHLSGEPHSSSPHKLHAIVIGALVLGHIIGGFAVYAYMQSRQNASMSHTMDAMTADLKGKTGDAFDKAFLQGMIIHHEGAVAMAEQARQTANHAEIKQMAQDIISAQRAEITTMQRWLQDWYSIQPPEHLQH